MLDDCEACKNILRIVALLVLGAAINIAIFSVDPKPPTMDQASNHPEWLYTIYKQETFQFNGRSFQRVWFLPDQKDGKVLPEENKFKVGDTVVYEKYACRKKGARRIEQCLYKYLGRRPSNT